MKKYLFVLVAVVMALVGCTDQQLLNETLADKSQIATGNEFKALIEQARWGDGQAFLKLADCYRDGKGVEKDMFGMLAMVYQANEFGALRRMEDFMENLPEGTDSKLFYNAATKLDNQQMDEAMAIAERLIARGAIDGYIVKGLVVIENGDTLEGRRLIEQAALEGSSFAQLALCLTESSTEEKPDIERLKALSDKIPFVNMILARMYAKMGTEDDEVNLDNDRLVIHYLLKADEHACLDKRGAKWLLSYHRYCSYPPLSERDILRLQTMVGEASTKQEGYEHEDSEAIEEIQDSVVVE